MNRRTFSKAIVSLSAIPLMSFKKKPVWSVQLIRHATLIIKANYATMLVDPMLSPKGAMDPVGNAANDTRIPMIDLPMGQEQLAKVLQETDIIFLTHTHRDHWDPVAQQMIDKSKPIFCQPADLERIKGQGFMHVTVVEDKIEYNDMTIYRTGGQHGIGDIGQRMGTVSGYVFELGNDRLYLAGDTIWCVDVEDALKKFKPQVTVVNAGGAQFLTGGPITMNAEDVKTVATANPKGKVVAVHMDTINHCKVTRQILKKVVAENNLTNVRIPDDGSTLTF